MEDEKKSEGIDLKEILIVDEDPFMLYDPYLAKTITQDRQEDKT